MGFRDTLVAIENQRIVACTTAVGEFAKKVVKWDILSVAVLAVPKKRRRA